MYQRMHGDVCIIQAGCHHLAWPTHRHRLRINATHARSIMNVFWMVARLRRCLAPISLQPTRAASNMNHLRYKLSRPAAPRRGGVFGVVAGALGATFWLNVRGSASDTTRPPASLHCALRIGYAFAAEVYGLSVLRALSWRVVYHASDMLSTEPHDS